MANMVRLFSSLRPAAFATSLAVAAACHAQAGNLLKNPGFENGLAGWTPTPAGSQAFHVTPEAASMGKTGLRISGSEAPAHLMSTSFPAAQGCIFRFTGWSRPNGTKAAQISLEFHSQDGTVLKPDLTPGYWPAFSPKDEEQFQNVTLQAAAPADAVSVSVHIQAPRSEAAGSTDLDDCCLEEVAADAAGRQAVPPPIDVEPLLADINAYPTRGQRPPMIVLKLDDLGLSGISKGPDKVKGPDHNWQRISDFVEKRNVKVAIGIVAKSLEICGDPFVDWMKKMHAGGKVEFWFHGYDHAGWTNASGVVCSEFFGRSNAEQKQRFEKSQELMMQKVGFPLLAFGPGGGPRDAHFDAATIQAKQDDPHMKAWMYSQPIDAQGRALQAKGKVAVLGRVWSVNIEPIVGHARFDTFLQGYAHNRGRSYFVLQGHPPLWGWGDDNFNEFYKIVDFLQAQGATFVTPSECGDAVLAAERFKQPAH